MLVLSVSAVMMVIRLQLLEMLATLTAKILTAKTAILLTTVKVLVVVTLFRMVEL